MRNGQIQYAEVLRLHVDEARFTDPGLNLPTEFLKPNAKHNPATKYGRVEIRSTKDEAGSTNPEGIRENIVEMVFNKDGPGIVLSVTNEFKDFNAGLKELVSDVLQKTPSSGLIFQGVAVGCVANKPATALRVVIRKTVYNPSTINTLQEAYQRNGFAVDQKGVFRTSADKVTPEGQAFDAMMQTKNVEVVTFMFADHHRAFRDKVIRKIVTFPDPSFSRPVGSGLKPTADIFLILAKK